MKLDPDRLQEIVSIEFTGLTLPGYVRSSDQLPLFVPNEVILQVFLLLGLGGQLQIDMMGEFCKITKALLSAADAIPAESCEGVQEDHIFYLQL